MSSCVVRGGGRTLRQTQLLVGLAESATFKRDVRLAVHPNSSLSLALCGETLLDGSLLHRIVADESEWFIEDGLPGLGAIE